MSRQALGLQGERWKNDRNACFSRRIQWMLTTFWGFNENEFLETSNDLDDSEISLFIEENRNVNTTKKTKTDLNVWKRWCESVKLNNWAIEEIPAEQLNDLLCHLFVKVRKRDPSLLRSCLQQMHNCCRSEISTAISFKTTHGYWSGRRWLSLKCVWIVNKLLFNFVWPEFRVLFVLSSSFFRSFTRWPRTLLLIKT